MKLAISTVLLSTLLSSALADYPTPPPYGPYNITNFFSYCIPTVVDTLTPSCHYIFDIEFAADDKYPPPWESDTEPAFYTSCAGNNSIAWTPCDFVDVSVNITKVEGTIEMVDLAIQHTWSTPNGPGTTAAQYWDTGDTKIELLVQKGEFEIFATSQRVEV